MSGVSLWIDRGARQFSLSRNGVMLVEHENRQQRIGLRALDQLIIRGNAFIDTNLLRALGEENVTVILLPVRGSKNARYIFPQRGNALERRRAQYRCHFDPLGTLKVARSLVETKIEFQRKALPSLMETTDGERLARKIHDAVDLDELRGIEGSMAARYFARWSDQWPDKWGFKGRNRRPPRDPVNAMISLAYTLAVGIAGRLLVVNGLDPEFGYLHAIKSGRPSLALDIIEPARPLVDQWVRTLVANQWLSRDMFNSSEKEGCRLNKDGREIFYQQWFREGEAIAEVGCRSGLAAVLMKIRAYRRPLSEEKQP